MSKLILRWDEMKNVSNYQKHGIRFDEAGLVFNDPLRLAVQDRDVDGEERWQTIGVVRGFTLILVAHTTRDEADGYEVIRIISARPAEPKEIRRYENENG